jgi:Zn-dependent protease with chaperone function
MTLKKNLMRSIAYAVIALQLFSDTSVTVLASSSVATYAVSKTSIAPFISSAVFGSVALFIYLFSLKSGKEE